MSALARHRKPAVFALVLLSHGAGLWALQQGLQQSVVEAITPAEMLVEIMTTEAPPAPAVLPRQENKAPARPSLPAAQPVAQPAVPTALPASPTLVASTTSVAPATTHVPAATAATTTTSAAAVGAGTAGSPSAASASAGSAVASAPVLQPPSSDADYLNNPKPAYPAMSRRMGETGKVVVRTLIGVDGTAQQAEVLRSSGFERLDRAAVETALKWRYVPGKRAGIPEAMWFNVPLVFVLD
jgi:protein TonB